MKQLKSNDSERLETPMYLTLGQAASACGKSKSTLSKDLKSGKLSYREKNSSGYKIDTAELERVYTANIKKTPKSNDSERLETPDFMVLKTQLEAKDQLIDRLQSEIEDLRHQRDKWEQQATAQTRLLEHQATSKQGWFNILLGKKK